MAGGKQKKSPLLQSLIAQFPEKPEKEIYSLILCGEVTVNGETIRDPKHPVLSGDAFCFKKPGYVSRGAEKLSGALDAFDFDVRGHVFLDAGCSSGGFTQVLLLRGAARVYAVDVGYNVLDYSLRSNEKVVLMERCNIMNVSRLDPPPYGAVADLSFRSMRGAASHILNLCTANRLIALIKPQFEWQDPPPEFNGVVEDPAALGQVLLSVAEDLKKEGVGILGAAPSAIKGRKGNQEFFFLLARGEGLAPSEIPGLLTGTP